MSSVKALLKEFFGTEEFKRSRKVAKVRAVRIAEVKDRIAAFLRGDETLQAFAGAVRSAVEEQTAADAPGGAHVPVWGFGGPGTSLFLQALLRAAPEPKIEAELRRALAGIDTRDPSDRLRTFAAFIARTARDANLGPESNLHVGYATCFLSYCWHALYDLEVPVFYGASHRGVKALLGVGLLQDNEYGSRDLAERFRAFLRITRGLNELVHKVNPQLNFWTVESFLEWAAPRYEAVAGAGSVSGVMQAIDAPSRPRPGEASVTAGFGTMAGMNPLAAEAAAAPEVSKVTIGSATSVEAQANETRRLETRTQLKVPPKLMAAAEAEPGSARISGPGAPSTGVAAPPPPDDRPWYSGNLRRPDEPQPPEPPQPPLDPAALKDIEARPAGHMRLGKLTEGEKGAAPAAPVAPPAASAEAPTAPPAPPEPASRREPVGASAGPGFGSGATSVIEAATGPASTTPAEAIATLARETRFPETLLRDLDALLARRGQVALEGPTGVGKTHLARRFAAVFAGSPQRVRYVQLHASFRYEDFVEGPAPANNGKAVPGVFKAFAARAAADPAGRYVLVLDELGRCDVVSVLGEVFSLLEFRAEEVLLPYSREPFSIPKNLYVIATASATAPARALGDAALRRRFAFLRLDPSAEILRGYLEKNRPEYAWVADLFSELNRRLARDAGGPRAQLGQSVFMQPGLDDGELERIFAYDVRPLVEAAVREPAKLAEFDLSSLKAAVDARRSPRG